MIETKRLEKIEWDALAEKAHLIVFDEVRPSEMNRYDYTIVTQIEKTIQCFVTVRELDSESVYLPYGGAFPSSKGSKASFESFHLAMKYLKDHGIKNVMFYVRNTNIKMINFSLSGGFLINGIRHMDGEIFVEFLLQNKGE